MRDLEHYLKSRAAMIDAALDEILPAEEETPYLLHRAMRYSALAPGKRIRPVLCLAGAEAVGGAPSAAVKTACALELIHAYSLIHDDLPSMDNDDFRRGRPTSHKVFGEGVAILAGDAILSLAFEASATDKLLTDPQCRLIVAELARASGSRGLAGGQEADLCSQGKKVTRETVEFIHARKTGALITAAVVCGAIAGHASPAQLAALTDYGAKIGLAFQIKDDLLDIQGDPKKLGKSIGQDGAAGKATYPAVVGMEAARDEVSRLVAESLAALSAFSSSADPLRWIARFIEERDV
jgi:geranylgeranyl diphosphate synthase type II